MKISELNQKTFLSGPSAATQSYVLINYEDDNTSKPITYRATVDELGKAIANNLKLYKADNSGGARTISTSQGAYVDDGRKYFVNSSEKTKIANMPQFDSAHNIGYDNNGTFTPVIYAPTDSALASLYIDTSNNSIHKIDSEGDRLMITGIALNECPLVVYSSTEGTIGYFDVDDSEF